MNTKHRSPIWKVSKEEFENIIKSSKNFTEILSHFGLKNKGSNHITLKKRINYENIDISHIYIELKKTQKNRKFPLKRKPIEYYLISNSTYGRNHIKKYLIESGVIEYKCCICGLKNEWQNKNLVLVLDHINGISNDHRLENLRFLCPNCNSQTKTFAGRNVKHIKKKCIKCNGCVSNSSESGMCIDCYRNEFNNYRKYTIEDSKEHIEKIEKVKQSRHHVIWPTKEQLEKIVWEKPTVKIAKEFNVSDSAINKWCKSYGINKPPRGYWGFNQHKNSSP